uniref:dolichyl-P-Man:Man5GlcNAc2-PP-dolichol alpha-1,3-mannosyltransferase n=1 Tax=Acrobeloides nanus TaxID=290746 RepID=A0A914DYT6_9BILA
MAVLLFVADTAISIFVVKKVPYTEIDWSTYMQQVECYLNGERNYTQIKGDTGPIVYPAGHLIIYRLLYVLTNSGQNILRGQYIFVGLYLLNILFVFRIFYKSSKVPPFALIFLCATSYRIHSIYMLRLFNDPVAMLFLFISINFFIDQNWSIGCFFYSIAVSIKMNILLFAPALFFILLIQTGLKKTIFYLSICGFTQILIAIQFLLYDPVSYLMRSFELGRVFLFKWTVNWRFLSEEIFLDKRLHLSLLGLHLLILGIFGYFMWFRSQGGLKSLLQKLIQKNTTRIEANELLFALFTANLIGITFARSLHYQFYSWYFHTLPYLLFSTLYSKKRQEQINAADFPVPWLQIFLRAAILLGIEYCWNTYPSTSLSSGLLHVFHAAIFVILIIDRAEVSLRKKKN